MCTAQAQEERHVIGLTGSTPVARRLLRQPYKNFQAQSRLKPASQAIIKGGKTQF
jgi:hypothetical protein